MNFRRKRIKAPIGRGFFHNYSFEDIIARVKTGSWDQVFKGTKICLHTFKLVTINID
jgi:hypothetical protein